MSRWARLRSSAPVVLALLALLATAAVVASLSRTRPPLDPASTGPDGTKALVTVLRELGNDVEVVRSAPGPRHDTALVLLGRQDAAGPLRDFARAGGTLVVADPESPLTPVPIGPTSVGPLPARLEPDCDLPALGAGGPIRVPPGAVFEVPDGATGCYPRGEGAWLVAHAEGRGHIVSVGGQGFLTNRFVGDADNAVVLAALLAPSRGTSVAVVTPDIAPADGTQATLGDLVPDRVRLALWQLLTAFGVTVLWRARRLGRPLIEHQPVPLAGSELTSAVGNLLQAGRARGHAADLLRGQLRRDAAERLGLHIDTADAELATAAGRCADADDAHLTGLLSGPPPTDDAGLVRLAEGIETARRALFAPPTGRATRPEDRQGAVRAR